MTQNLVQITELAMLKKNTLDVLVFLALLELHVK